MPVILDTWEAGIRRITIQPKQNIHRTPSQPMIGYREAHMMIMVQACLDGDPSSEITNAEKAKGYGLHGRTPA
jgi:hypothetical protein